VRAHAVQPPLLWAAQLFDGAGAGPGALLLHDDALHVQSAQDPDAGPSHVPNAQYPADEHQPHPVVRAQLVHPPCVAQEVGSGAGAPPPPGMLTGTLIALFP